MLILKSASISTCQTWRYRLERTWGDGKGMVLWIMLNPSTADAKTDDATIKKITEFTHRWCYSGLVVCNLYAYRCTDPKELKGLDSMTRRGRLVARLVRHFGLTPMCFKMNKNGSPVHPLYQSYKTNLIEFKG